MPFSGGVVWIGGGPDHRKSRTRHGVPSSSSAGSLPRELVSLSRFRLAGAIWAGFTKQAPSSHFRQISSAGPLPASRLRQAGSAGPLPSNRLRQTGFAEPFFTKPVPPSHRPHRAASAKPIPPSRFPGTRTRRSTTRQAAPPDIASGARTAGAATSRQLSPRTTAEIGLDRSRPTRRKTSPTPDRTTSRAEVQTCLQQV